MSGYIQIINAVDEEDPPEVGMEIEISPLKAALIWKARRLGLITAYEKVSTMVSRHHHARLALGKLFLAAGAAQYFDDRQTAEENVLNIGWNVAERLPYERECNGIKRDVFFSIVCDLIAQTGNSPSMRKEIVSYTYLGDGATTGTRKSLILMSGFTGKALEVIRNLPEKRYSARQKDGRRRYHQIKQAITRGWHVNLDGPIYPIKLTPLRRPLYLVD